METIRTVTHLYNEASRTTMPIVCTSDYFPIMKGSMMCVASICLAIAFSACDPFKIFQIVGLCREDAIIGDMSPNGHYVVTVYKRTCGATTGWDTYIIVEPNSRHLGRDRKNVVFGIEGLYGTAVTWIDNTHLRVEGIRWKTDKIFKQENSWRDVQISYISHGDQ